MYSMILENGEYFLYRKFVSCDLLESFVYSFVLENF